jgi:hypothetical protein
MGRKLHRCRDMLSAFRSGEPKAPDEQHQHDRHYPIRLDLEYRLKDSDHELSAGSGSTIYISSSRVLFEAKNALPPGSLVELAVAWPVELENTIKLRLIILGRTVEVNGNCTLVDVLRHEFRIRALPTTKRRLSVASTSSSGRTMAASAG